MRHLTYLAVLLSCLGLTLPLERAFGCAVLNRLRTVALAVLPGFGLFLSWDLYAIGHRQWVFDRKQLTGLMLPGGLPVEEALFFLVVPVAAILTYESVRVCLRTRQVARRPAVRQGVDR